MVTTADIVGITMDFASRLAAARKERALTQQDLADRTGVHVTQIRRYEAGTGAPTLDVLRNLAIALHVSTDSLVFADKDRDPPDDLRLAFEATHDLDPDERAMLKGVIEAVLLKHDARRWAS